MMSDKKNTPALYELYYADKPKRRGLFGGRKKNSTFQLSSNVPPANEPYQRIATTPAFQSPVSSQLDEPIIDDSPSCFSWSEGRVVISLPLWLFMMFVVAMVMCFLASYKLGYASYLRQIDEGVPLASSESADNQGNDIVNNVPIANNTPLSPEMNAALNSQADFNLINGAARTNASQGSPASDNNSGNTISTYQRPARCLIVFGHNNREELEIIKDFFDQNGLILDIAKQARDYVLVTREGFTSSRDPEYQQLKDKVYKIGEKYIVNRPDGGLRIILRTFSQAYAIDTDKLDFDL